MRRSIQVAFFTLCSPSQAILPPPPPGLTAHSWCLLFKQGALFSRLSLLYFPSFPGILLIRLDAPARSQYVLPSYDAYDGVWGGQPLCVFESPFSPFCMSFSIHVPLNEATSPPTPLPLGHRLSCLRASAVYRVPCHNYDRFFRPITCERELGPDFLRKHT